MRVAHFGKYAFLRTGGVERHVVDLTTALVAKGVDVTVFTYDLSSHAEACTINGVHVEPVPSVINLSSQSIAPALVARSRRLARERRFDVIHQHWPDPFAHFAASLVPGEPAHVVSWHTDIVRQRIIRPFYRALAPRVLKRPDAVVGATKSHLSSSQIACFAPPERRHIVPYSIDARAFEATNDVLRQAQALKARYGGAPLIFALGRHVYYKGFDVLIRAMAGVPGILLLGGEGPLTVELKALAAGLAGKVQFVGAIPEWELPSFYYACDVFCFPSVAQTEAFGLVQAEAMVCGKPVVNTLLGNGVNEVAPDNLCALTVRPSDVEGLASALCRILGEPELACRLGAAGRQRVRMSYSVEAMVDCMVGLYEKVMGDRRRWG